jgi:ketosteroid isomerase-like protein
MDMNDKDQDFGDAVRKLREAMTKVVTGDPSAIKALYSHEEDVTGFYDFCGCEKGWKAVSKRWDWAASQFHGGWASYENLSAGTSGDMGFTVDIETLHLAINGKPEPAERTNRVTHIFRMEDNEWRLVHRHANRFERKPS